jgi:protein O-GlcNAc transferase
MCPENRIAEKAPEVAPERYREIKYRHSRDFVEIVRKLRASLLISTYQAGKLVAVGIDEAGLRISMHSFDRAMGIALHPTRIAVGSREAVWLLNNAQEFAPRLEPEGRYDACYLTRQAFVTGNIHSHEMAWVDDELWVVNTLFSCLSTLHDDFSFVARWRPPFISELAAQDRCHLNGLAIEAGRAKYVTVMAASDEPAGWRATKATSGRILEFDTGQTVSEGLSMPHSPRVYGGRLWVLNSGRGALELVDPKNGNRETVSLFPGYTRGLAFHGDFAFVGMSRIRETAVFGGVPIAEYRDELRCAVAVVRVSSGATVAYLEFETGVEEIFDVQVLGGTRCVSVTGPSPTQDDAQPVWVVPRPGQLPTGGLRASVAGAASSRTLPQPLSHADVAGLALLGRSYHQQGRFAEAVNTLQQVVAARPDSAESHNNLGNALQDFGRQDLAIESYHRAIAVQATFAAPHQNLGYMLLGMGKLDDGVKHLRQAQTLQPNQVNRVMLATALPVIYASLDDLQQRRRQMESAVQLLIDENVQVDATRSLLPTNFSAAYQGYNDRDLQCNLGRIYRAPDLVQPGAARARGDRIRVGFLSSHFRNHTIGRLNLGRISRLDRQRFEVVVIAAGHHRDNMSQRFRAVADEYIEILEPVENARRQVASLALDVLLFADVGMNSLTYTLAHSRMAPVQCVTWGHPVTTGSASIDYFISSSLLETPQADDHYTERLVRLANLGTYYERPVRGPKRTRESFGLDDNRHLYFCPQTLFKFHPDFDPLLAEILSRDPLGDLVLIEGRQPFWKQLLEHRFVGSLGSNTSRVRFLPPQPHADFLELNALADVLLDPIHFGGGNTSYEGLAVGTPIVTLPGPFLRSRITLALYRKMGMADCIAHTSEMFVDLAVRLGTDPSFRGAMSEKINLLHGALYEDDAEVRELERFLQWAAGDNRTSWSPGS